MENKFYLDNKFELANASQDDNFLKIEGYACRFDLANLNGQICDAKSFDAFFNLYNSGKLKPKINWEHNGDQIIGGIDDVAVMDDGLYLQARLNMNIPLVRDMIAPNVMAGDIDSFSTEGRTLNSPMEDLVERKDGSFYVRNFILTAVAVVTTPADWTAKFGIANYIENWKALRAEEEAKKNMLRLGLIM